MCILFVYNGTNDEHSDYRMILISNRDEYYDRPTANMALWSDEPVVIAGRDLQAKEEGTWLAISPTNKKIGVLLNLPGFTKENAFSRGKIAADYVKNKEPVQNYIESIKPYIVNCNGFIFISVDFCNSDVSISSYNNANDHLKNHNMSNIGFSNSLPETPLKKTAAGERKMKDICNEFNKDSMEKELVDNLIKMLKSDESHLPDKILETRHPKYYKELSSIYVNIPQNRYGTRTHTIVLLTKKGRLSVTELTQQMPIEPASPVWEKTEFNYNEIY